MFLMPGAAVKTAAKNMATLSASLPFRCFLVFLLVGGAFLFGGAAFPAGPVHFFPSSGPGRFSPGVNPGGTTALQGTAPGSRYGAVLERFDEMMFAERAVSTSV